MVKVYGGAPEAEHTALVKVLQSMLHFSASENARIDGCIEQYSGSWWRVPDYATRLASGTAASFLSASTAQQISAIPKAAIGYLAGEAAPLPPPSPTTRNSAKANVHHRSLLTVGAAFAPPPICHAPAESSPIRAAVNTEEPDRPDGAAGSPLVATPELSTAVDTLDGTPTKRKRGDPDVVGTSFTSFLRSTFTGKPSVGTAGTAAGGNGRNGRKRLDVHSSPVPLPPHSMYDGFLFSP